MLLVCVQPFGSGWILVYDCAEEMNGGCNARQLGWCTVRVLLATLPGSSRACVLTSSRFQAMLWPVARTAIPGPSFPGSPCLSAAPRTKQWNRFRGMFSLPHPVTAIITWKICSSYFICEIKCVGECDSMMGSHRFYKLEQLCSVTSSFLQRSIDTELAIKQFRFTCLWQSVIERQGDCSSRIGSNSHKLDN